MIIYNKNGVVFLDTVVDDSSFLYNEICGSEYVRLDFSLTEYAEIPLGAYIIHRDVQYTLHEAPTIEMVSQEEYKITATFEAPAKQLEQYSLRNYVDKRVDFMLTAKPAEHVGMVLEALRVRDKAWAIGNCIDAAEKTITYSYVSCMEALQMIADAFDTEWEIIDHTINLGKVEHLNDAPLRLSYGKDFGLNPGVGRANLGEARISAVYPQGTDRNINASTYGNPTLLLPKNQLIGYDGYRFDDELGYDKSNAVLYSTDIWGTCVYSASSSGVEAEGVLDCTEIYPQREGTVTNVVVRNADSNLYDIQDNTIPDSLDYQAVIIPGNELSIVFQTGMLAGKEFGASYIHNGATDSTKRLFQIRPQEHDGVMMPGGNYIPQVGDKYAVFGVALPESYLADNDTKTGASWDMLRKCVKHLYEAEKPQYSFTGELSSKWVRQQYSSVSPYLRIGAVISFGRVAFQQEATLVRIESIKQYINTPYAVELSFGDRVIPTPYKIASKTIESRRSVEISRIASQTAMQINAVKQNAVAPPPVNDTVPFANDLTGVIEATPEEFTYRPSAGNKSIRDASAVIRRIKGNSLVLNQLATFKDNWSENGLTCVKEGNTIHLYGTVTEAFSYDTCRLTNYLSQGLKRDGRKYLISMNAPDGVAYGINGYTIKDTKPHFWSDKADSVWYGYISIKIPVGTTVDYVFSDPQIIDLTRMFDTGNEPTTIDDFYTRISKDIDINTYNEGEIISMIVNAIETTGFNQWDERWELGALATNTGGPVANHERGRSVNFFDVIPNATYYCATIAPTTTNSSGTVGSMLVWWYDSSRTMIKYEDITNKTRVAPSNARYAKICTYGGDVNAIFNGGVNINLSHSGVRNGEYEPYKRNIRLLPEIYKYFPDGMNGIGDVYDEINSENAVTRIGRINLGTLNWEGTSHNRLYAANISDGKEHKKVNIITHKYPYMGSVLGVAGTTFEDKSLFNYYNANNLQNALRIYIKDTSYSDVTAFKEGIQGVYLYYELAEPKITPITEPIQLDYVVDDFGTEKAVAFGNSAPFRADIVYQFNAEGRIRDNSRNIERVESTITTRLIPSQTAMLGLPNKVMTWDGNKTLMSLPIAEDIDHWDLEESVLGTIPTSQQVREYVKSVTDNLTPSQSATLESSNRVMVWNGDYAMTSLPIVANFAQWGAGAIPTGQQVIDYISAIKGSLAAGLTPKETLTIPANGQELIGPNKVYEITTASSTAYDVGLKIITTSGVDAAADNEWRIRIDTRTGFSGRIVFEPLAGYSIRWAYSDVSGPLTAPNIADGYIWDIQFRMIGRTLLGSYKKY